MRLTSLAVAAVLCVFLAACGDGGSLSTSQYREQLDSACRKLIVFNQQLPQKMKDEHLDVSQAQKLADDNGREFVKTIEGLKPPSELKDAHKRLLAKGDEPTPSGDDQAELKRWILGFADIYDDLGATGCAKGERAVADQIAA
jgi:hypothetical protein